MYNERTHFWESASYEDAVVRWALAPENADNPQAIYVLADRELEKISGQSGSAEAVFLMERAAKRHYEPAAFAMAQLFHYGWGVDQDIASALAWYGVSAQLGNETAAKIAEEIRTEQEDAAEKPKQPRKQKTAGEQRSDKDEKNTKSPGGRKNPKLPAEPQPKRETGKKSGRRKAGILVGIIAVLVILVIILAAVLLSSGSSSDASSDSSADGVVVGEDTELVETSTVEEFNEALNDLVAEYDDELVISGQLSTNRLMLAFEGDGIDISAFPAATVIADEDNFVIIQFETEEDAAACLETLSNTDGVLFVEEDDYSTNVDTGGSTEGSTDDSGTSDSEADSSEQSDADSSFRTEENTADQSETESADSAYVETSSVTKTSSTESILSSSGIPYTSSYTGYTYYTWGAEYLGLDQFAAWLVTQDTREVVAAVIDTGTAVRDETADRILEGVDITGDAANGQTDTNGHGTHVSGIILQCTRGLDVSILPVRVFGSADSTSEMYVIAGIRYAIDAGVDVINMSLGSDEYSASEEYYIQEAVDAGIVVVKAAGNEACDTEDYGSSDMEEIIVVGAVDSDGTVCDFSNYGDSVDVTAPGADITSYAPDGGMAVMDGTSQAAPHIAALAAMMLTVITDKTPAQIEHYIKNVCISMGDTDYYGEGIPWAAYLAE